jgi:hypothetical protein
LLGGCTIAALLGAGRAERFALALQEERQAPPEHSEKWVRAS